MKMKKIMETMTKVKNKTKMVTTIAGLAMMLYMTNPVIAHAATASGLTMSGLKEKINKFTGAIMALEVAIAAGVFGGFSFKDAIAALSAGDEQERKAALKNIKGKAPIFIAILIGAEVITLIASYFVSSVTMPSVTM